MVRYNEASPPADDLFAGSDFTEEELNEFIQYLIAEVGSQFSKDSTFEDARHYAENSFERNSSSEIANVIDEAMDGNEDKLADGETRHMWKMLHNDDYALKYIKEKLGPDSELEEFGQVMLDAIQDAWNEFWYENAGAQSYDLEFEPTVSSDDDDDTPPPTFDEIIIERLDEERLYGYEGKYVYLQPNREDAEKAEVINQNWDDFTFDSDSEELLAQYSLDKYDIQSWVETAARSGGSYGSEVYVNGWMFMQEEGYWSMVVDQSELWDSLDGFMDARLDDTDLFDTNLDEEALIADVNGIWKELLVGDEKVTKREPLGEPEEDRVMGFETDQGDFEFFALKNYPAIRRQGSQMGQCVGNRKYGYAQAVEDGESAIISMRTKAGKPKFTLEAVFADDGTFESIGEVKGKANRLPGFGNQQGVGKLKPVEVEVLARFIEELGLDPHEVDDMQPGLAALEGKTLKRVRRNPKVARKKCCAWCGR